MRYILLLALLASSALAQSVTPPPVAATTVPNTYTAPQVFAAPITATAPIYTPYAVTGSPLLLDSSKLITATLGLTVPLPDDPTGPITVYRDIDFSPNDTFSIGTSSGSRPTNMTAYEIFALRQLKAPVASTDVLSGNGNIQYQSTKARWQVRSSSIVKELQYRDDVTLYDENTSLTNTFRSLSFAGTGVTASVVGVGSNNDITVTIPGISSGTVAFVAPQGTASAVGYGFLSDPDTGFFQTISNQMNAVTGGTSRTTWDGNGMTVYGQLSCDGAISTIDQHVSRTGYANLPGFTFTGNLTSGLFQPTSGNLAIATNAVTRTYWNSTGKMMVATIAVPTYLGDFGAG